MSGHGHTLTCSCERCRRDPDPAPREFGVVTDFSQIWSLGLDLDRPESDELVAVPVVRQRIERIERPVTVVRTLGRRRWIDHEVVTVYRTVRPCGSRYAVNVGCRLDHGHLGFHEHPGFRWS